MPKLLLLGGLIMCELKITTLSENTANSRGLIAEHGLSLLIEYHGFRVLFDTGQGSSVVANARAMNINLADINCIVLSHGHYDHTGGLFSVLRKTGSKRIYCHPAALRPKYKLADGNSYCACGIPHAKQELINFGGEFICNTTTTELTPGLYLTGEIPRNTDYETVNPTHFIEKEGSYLPDIMPDDQALVAVTGKGPVVITGCAHAGLINTICYALQITNSRHIYGLVGGTHLIQADKQRLDKTINQLKRYNPQLLAVSHCTGFTAQAELYRNFDNKFVLNNVGNVIEI